MCRQAIEVNRRDYRAWYGLGQTYEILKMHHYCLYYFKQVNITQLSCHCVCFYTTFVHKIWNKRLLAMLCRLRSCAPLTAACWWRWARVTRSWTRFRRLKYYANIFHQ